MAVQIWTQDQVPQLTYTGLAQLGGGIAGGVTGLATGLAAGLERRAEENKRIAQAAKAMDVIYDTLPEDQLPMPYEEWQVESPRAKADLYHGIMAAADYGHKVASTKAELARAALIRDQTANAAREPQFLADISRYAPPGDLPYNIPPNEFEMYSLPEGQAQPGLRELSASAGRTKYNLNLASVDDILRATAKSGASTEAAPPDILTLRPASAGHPAVEIVHSPKTGKWEFVVGGGNQSGMTFEQRTQLADRQNLYAQKRALTAAKSRALAAPEKADYQRQIDAIDGQLDQLGKTAADRVAEAEAYVKQLQEERRKIEGELGTSSATKPKGGEGEVIMLNDKGQFVVVPRARLGEAIGLGYRFVSSEAMGKGYRPAQ